MLYNRPAAVKNVAVGYAAEKQQQLVGAGIGRGIKRPQRLGIHRGISRCGAVYAHGIAVCAVVCSPAVEFVAPGVGAVVSAGSAKPPEPERSSIILIGLM